MTRLDVTITPEGAADAPAILGLEERAFGPGRFARAAYRLREGNAHDQALSCVARVSTLVVGSVRLSHIRIGHTPALLLGPLTVDPAFHARGIGTQLMAESLQAAQLAQHLLVVLVGDEAYYARAGFKHVPAGRLIMPGPVDTRRVLIRELVPGAFEGVSGRVIA